MTRIEFNALEIGDKCMIIECLHGHDFDIGDIVFLAEYDNALRGHRSDGVFKHENGVIPRCPYVAYDEIVKV